MSGDDGTEAVRAAECELNNLRASEDAVVRRTLRLIEQDATLVLEGLGLHTSAVRLIAGNAEPSEQDAALLVALALQGDLLRSGRTSVLRGYYPAALSQLRLIRELAEYAMAVRISGEVARKLLAREKVEYGEIAKLIDGYVAREEPSIAADMAHRREVRQAEHQLAHTAPDLLGLVHAWDGQTLSVNSGPRFDADSTRRCVAYYIPYVKHAVEALGFAAHPQQPAWHQAYEAFNSRATSWCERYLTAAGNSHESITEQQVKMKPPTG